MWSDRVMEIHERIYLHITKGCKVSCSLLKEENDDLHKLFYPAQQ